MARWRCGEVECGEMLGMSYYVFSFQCRGTGLMGILVLVGALGFMGLGICFVMSRLEGLF
ncbi:hypothetical protein METBIDRAFT_32718 [Metschnikowia bicuspidata var. bicuspidata NRRL YB-4993]|uniref:Uncharacterized protein n=1 Tax=Metschnikowia bicuspidata var. bicuspidata NRRL YB-4993 TaxID=869754 RepID=A0A1A0HA67_9ASCO|nr:hypothetical protein METBIDRAFT_32718 [Metschnikowia bicuspidata var. bicuspidata NRRL YB-4993]OBA20768.1 hypothetical protein METBIDRAFT_32718 [Metschnikowia bicuspidata var. bicuspidata NRRL YB-4993]